MVRGKSACLHWILRTYPETPKLSSYPSSVLIPWHPYGLQWKTAPQTSAMGTDIAFGSSMELDITWPQVTV